MLVSLFATTCSAQNIIGISTLQGKILKHSKKINYNPPTYSYNVELQYFKKTTGNKYWHHAFGMPTVGLMALVNNYNDSVLGATYVLAPTIQFTLWQQARWNIHLRTAAGPAIATQYWQRKTLSDTFANYLGSRLNMYGLLQFGAEYRASKNVSFIGGIALNHVSNGAMLKPNLGINLIGANIAMRYHINPVEQETYTTFETDAPENYFGVDIKLAASANEYGNGNGPMLPVYYSGIFANYTLRGKHKFILGLDFDYNKKTEIYIRATSQEYNSLFWSSSVLALVAGDELQLGKFSIPMQLGVYVTSTKYNFRSYYQRFGVYYRPWFFTEGWLKGLYAGPMLKSAGSVAEYIDWQVGYHYKFNTAHQSFRL
jgi:hypothetical protein